ncbi:MAG: hypothetical protein IJ944_06505 [Clostridia bacterium]|nr:hypothetical protein [Clostridia bacterium]
MRFFARICALLLCMAMLFTMGACHKKGETVMTIGDVEISSGLYLSFLIDAFNEFTQHKDISEAIGDTAVSSAKDYFEYELEGKDAITWIKDKAKDLCSEYAAVKSFFKEYDLSLTNEEIEAIDSYADYYWENGYDEYYGGNGVSKESYRETLTFYTMKNVVFNYYYSKPNEETGKGGIKEVPMSELLVKLEEDYLLVETLSISTEETDDKGATVSKTDAEISKDKAKLEGYANRINKGSATFDEVNKEYQKEIGKSEESTQDTTTTDDGHNHEEGETHEEELKSIYPSTATLYSINDTDSNGQSATENYERFLDIKEDNKIEYGKATVVNEGTNQTLVIFYDLSKDEYYADQCRAALLKSLKEEDFEKIIDEKIGTLTINANNSLVKYYSPKKLNFGEEDNHNH